jgi:hypothetical protein
MLASEQFVARLQLLKLNCSSPDTTYRVLSTIFRLLHSPSCLYKITASNASDLDLINNYQRLIFAPFVDASVMIMALPKDRPIKLGSRGV